MLKRIFSYMKQYKKYAFLALFCIAVEAVLDMLGRSFDDAAAIGDGGIDVQLIRRSGLGVTLENGSAECRQAAQLIVPGCEQEGCMTLIEALIAQKERGKTR